MSDELDKLTDAELSELFAVEVAGWKVEREQFIDYWFDADGDDCNNPTFATDANAVLPWLEKFKEDCVKIQLVKNSIWRFTLFKPHVGFGSGNTKCISTCKSISFPRAACIALIRAKRAEKQEAQQ